MEQEIWKTAQYIFENGHKEVFEKYQVSNMGRVKSLDYRRSGKEGILKQSVVKAHDKSIMHQIGLRNNNNNNRSTLQVHRLVLSTFKEHEFFEGAVCDHVVARSETDCNNKLSNLHWVTVHQNGSTEHCKEARSKAMKGKHMNRGDQSKRIRVTNLTTGETTVYPSVAEAGRVLDISRHIIAARISQHNGYYKKLNLHFEYL